MRTTGLHVGCMSLVLLILMTPTWGQDSGLTAPSSVPLSDLVVQVDGVNQTLTLEGGTPFHRTTNGVTSERLIDVPGSPIRLALWSEIDEDGQVVPFYAISQDGQSMATVRPTSYVLKLRHGDFDPGDVVPPVDASLAAEATTNLHIVQFVTQPLEEYRTAITDLGGTVHHFFANHAHIVMMSPEVRDVVAQLPFVRWVGPFHPAYKLEEEIRDQIESGKSVEPRRYSIMLVERGVSAQDRVTTQIDAMGGEVHGTTPMGFRVEATLSLDQVQEVITLDDVMFIDRKGPLEVDMDIVREIGGADYLETVAGYTGQGVRAEVADTEVDEDHPEWSAPPIIHVAGSGTFHGTSVYGILFAQGVDPQARGLIPDGVGIFAYSSGLLGGGPTRYTHTAELVDPDGPYRTVLQTNSTGDPRTFFYTTISAEMDDILFINDIAITQSQSNAGNQDSRPQAWAKNIISGGAVNHYDTLTRSDDCWCSTASVGPADDGRIKPDLCFFYDDTYTTYAGGGYTQFGGTSGATPSIAGHLGLFFQMWSDGIFGNEVIPGGTVFENRPHMTTAKAALINTATQYAFSGTGHDLTRVNQGWGMPNVQYLYDMRNNISFIDETELLGNMESVEYVAYVEPGEPELRVTMVYADPMGVPGASEHRINDLTLKVTSPSSTVYWGNNGLLEGNWSTSGGTANTIDTVENVFIQDPEAGVWSVEVIASEVNEDSHVETPELDADFALVVSGAFLATCTSDGRISLDQIKYACADQAGIRVVDCDLNTNDTIIETVDVTIDSTSEPGGEIVTLTETAAETADFRGTITLSTTNGAGILQVADGDTVTATYIDADDGQGGTNVVVTDTATVDCVAPVISNVQTTNVEPRSATVTFDTDEPANGTVRYGLACAALTETASETGYGTAHTLNLTGLSDDTTYFYAVDAEDEAGNSSTNDNGGACYTFTTPEIPDYFTELFSADNDLDNLSLTFTPNASVDFYAGCTESISVLPIDPSGGTPLSFTPSSDDGYANAILSGGETVSLYGTSYGDFWVGTNGYITFTAGDSDYTESLADHFDLPRISVLFDDLNPGTGGTVSWKQLADRAVVTWENVPEYGTSNSNTFQVEMRFSGTIVISCLDIAATDGLAGLSDAGGVPVDFYESDLSAMGPCGGPTCDDGIQNQGEDRIDCGGPCPPCDCLSDGECDDGTFCNGAETCDAWGHCQAGSDPCPGQYCDEVGGICVDCLNNGHCDDGLFCNGAETCVGGSCQPGTDPCPGLGCDEVNDVCTPCDDNGTCEPGEDCNNCPNDCFTGEGAICGNGVCETANGEDCVSCPDDCNSRLGGKPSGRYCCGDGTAEYGITCSDSRCTGSGNTCTTDPAVPSCCGDGTCEGSEDGWNCEVDCGPPPFCGDDICDPGEDQCNCPADCGTPPATETDCADGIDNDCDGFTDGADPDCACLAKGEPCTLDSECCSVWCHRGACK
ncbi:MAG: S8 family serine peptidase [Phycisphaerales bacterium]|nr:MAG: S8 family serine peptidase [Phycisphaerales bacterium]